MREARLSDWCKKRIFLTCDGGSGKALYQHDQSDMAAFMPIWGIAAQLSVAFVTALVAIAVYRIQADKLFLEFRDKRDQALTDFLEACDRRQQAVTAISAADMVGLVDPEKYEAGNRDVIRTATIVRLWFGNEVERAVAECEIAMMTAHRTKMEWCADPKPAAFNERVMRPHVDAYSAIHRVRLVAGPYLNAGRRGLSTWQRLRAVVRAHRSSSGSSSL